MDEQGTSQGFAAANEAAVAQLESTFEAEGSNPAADQTVTTQSAANQATVSQAEAQPQEQTQEAEWSYDLDRKGQRHKLSRQEVDYLIHSYLDAADRAREQHTAQPAPPAQAPQAQGQDPMKAFVGRIEKLEAQLEAARTEKQVEEIRAKIDKAVSGLKIYGELKDPKHQGMVRELAMLRQYQDQNLSPETAAQQVEELLSSLLRDRASAYVQTKVAQAGKRVESGGTPAATSQKPLGAKDLANGNVMRSALHALKSAFSS